MSIESLIENSGQFADITIEADSGFAPPQTSMGGVDRSAPWPEVVSGVPCLVRDQSSTLNYSRNDGRVNVKNTRIYFSKDPTPTGLTTKHRITVSGGHDQVAVGVYAVQGVIDPNSMAELFQVDCERVRTP